MREVESVSKEPQHNPWDDPQDPIGTTRGGVPENLGQDAQRKRGVPVLPAHSKATGSDLPQELLVVSRWSDQAIIGVLWTVLVLFAGLALGAWIW